MSLKNKIIMTLSSLVLSQSVFAQEIPIKFAFVNDTDQTGSAFTYVTESINKGPVLEKNGGQGAMIYRPDGKRWASVGLWMADTNLGQVCIQDGHNINLDMNAYKGDIIKINYKVLLSDGGVECTCTGSACGVSAEEVKKYI